MRGEYGEVGRDDFCDGDPNPDMPDTLYLLLEDVETVGRIGGGGGTFPKFCRLETEFELVSPGGVEPPYMEFRVEEDLVVGTEPLVSLLESVLLSVLKLAFDRLRMSFKKEGAILHLQTTLTLQLNWDNELDDNTGRRNFDFASVARISVEAWTTINMVPGLCYFRRLMTDCYVGFR